MGSSRYDRSRPVGELDEAEARASSIIGRLVIGYDGITISDVANQVSAVLHATAIELRAGRPVPLGVRRAMLGLADQLRREMAPRR